MKPHRAILACVGLVRRARLTSASRPPRNHPCAVTKNAPMADAALLFFVLPLEIAGPIVLAGLLFPGIRSLLRARRLGRSLGASQGDAVARRLE